jgi:hypothetical protein
MENARVRIQEITNRHNSPRVPAFGYPQSLGAFARHLVDFPRRPKHRRVVLLLLRQLDQVLFQGCNSAVAFPLFVAIAVLLIIVRLKPTAA